MKDKKNSKNKAKYGSPNEIDKGRSILLQINLKLEIAERVHICICIYTYVINSGA